MATHSWSVWMGYWNALTSPRIETSTSTDWGPYHFESATKNEGKSGFSGSSLFCLLFVLGHCDHLCSCCDWYGLNFRVANRSIFLYRFLNFCVLPVQGQHKNREKYSTECYSDIVVLTLNFPGLGGRGGEEGVIRYWESEEEWFWPFETFSKLKTTFCKYWTSIKIFKSLF